MRAIVAIIGIAVAGSTLAQNRFIPLSVINATMGVTTERPAYFLDAAAADSTDAYFWAIGDFTNTRNNYDSLGFYSALWRLRFDDSQWLALDRVGEFPAAARWVDNVRHSMALFLPFSEEHALSTPLWWWGWNSHDTTKVPPSATPSSLLGYVPQALPLGRSIWRLVGLPPSSPGWRHDEFFSLSSGTMPAYSDTAVVLASSMLRQYDPSSGMTLSNPRVHVYVGNPWSDTLRLRAAIGIENNPFTYPAQPIVFNAVFGPDGALYAIAPLPLQIGSSQPSPIQFLKVDPSTGAYQVVSPTSGLTHLQALSDAFVWSHDSCLYVLCPRVRFAASQPSDTTTMVSAFRYNIFTGHCERLLGFSYGFPQGFSFYTPYDNGIACLSAMMIGDSSYPVIHFLQPSTSGQLNVRTLALKEIFPASSFSILRDFPRSITRSGKKLLVSTMRGLYIFDPMTTSVPRSEQATKLTAYPQPAPRGQIVRVQLPEAIESVALPVRIFDASGRECALSIAIENDMLSIPTDELASGTYWIVIEGTTTHWLATIVVE
jgi:hypothetical protein